MKVLPNGFFPQSYPKESHRNLKTVKGKVGKWQQGHEKLTHIGTDSWHLRKISFPSASWYISPYTQLYWSRQAAERGHSTATCQQVMSLSELRLLLSADGMKIVFVTEISPRAPSMVSKRNVCVIFRWIFLYRLCGFYSVPKFCPCNQCCNFLTLPLQPLLHTQHDLHNRNKGREE